MNTPSHVLTTGRALQDRSRRPLRVCFSAFHAYPLFDPRVTACVGGLETHAWLLATGLSGRFGFDVHFVVQAPRRFRRRRFDGVTVWNRGDGLDGIRRDVSQRVHFDERFPWLAVDHWHPRLLWQLPLLAMMRPFRNPPPSPPAADPFYSRMAPDVFCCFGVSAQSASVVATARAAGRPSVLFVESNNDLDERFRPGSTHVTPTGERGDMCAYAIEHASMIVAQHARQQRMLRERFGRASRVLPNLIDLQSWERAAARSSPLLDRLGMDRFALWIGRADDFHKRPRLCLELAERLSDVPFLMVLNPFDAAIEREVRAAAPPNVTIVEAVPFPEMPAVLHRAAVLVSTGSAAYEGAPNVFLQAAASGVPVASLETPLPDVVEAGFVADGELDRLAESVQTIWAHPEQIQEQCRRGRRRVQQRYDLPVVIHALEALLCELDGI